MAPALSSSGSLLASLLRQRPFDIKAPHPLALLCSFPRHLLPVSRTRVSGWKLVTFLAGLPPSNPLEYCLAAQEGSCELLGECMFSDRDSQKMNRGQA